MKIIHYIISVISSSCILIVIVYATLVLGVYTEFPVFNTSWWQRFLIFFVILSFLAWIIRGEQDKQQNFWGDYLASMVIAGGIVILQGVGFIHQSQMSYEVLPLLKEGIPYLMAGGIQIGITATEAVQKLLK